MTSPEVLCPGCREVRTLDDFRVFDEGPPKVFYDFCGHCADTTGYVKLYEDPTIFGLNPKVRARVLDKRTRPGLVTRNDAKVKREKTLRATELARREAARRHLIPFVRRFMPTYMVGWVHHDICRRLEKFVRDVEAGLSPRLILAMPPRAGKSLLASDMFPAWALGKHPEWEIISTSYAVSLPTGFSRNILDRIRDDSYRSVFPDTQLRSDSQGVEKWRLTKGGGYRAAGVGGGITGMGANILIVDDPFADDEEAQSDNNRQKVRDWFTSTAMTRLAPQNGVLIIATRWHDSDLSGACLALRDELLEQGIPPEEIDMWDLISYPALAEADEYLLADGSIARDPNPVPEGARLLRRNGEALHPERYDVSSLKRKKNTMPPRQWNAMYQQNPVPDDGEFFSRDMMRFEPFLPGTRDEYVILSAWDFAIGEKKTNDWTVGITVAIDAYNDMHVIDMVRGRLNTPQIIDAICEQINKHDIQILGMEDGHIKKTLWPLLEGEMRKRKMTVQLDEELKPVTDKMVRAGPLQALMQGGRVIFPTGQPWVERAIGEMLRFPAGTHDDIVDAMAWAARMYKRAPRPRNESAVRQKRVKSWKEDLKKMSGGAGDRSYMTA